MLFEAVLSLVGLLLLSVSVSGWGLWTLRLFKLNLPPADRLLLAHALGWGVITFPLLAAGMANWLYPAALWAVVLVGAVAAAVDRRVIISAARAGWNWGSTRRVHREWLLWTCLGLSALLLLFTLPGALGPPAETDGLRAELAQAKYWLQHHGVPFVPNYHWNQPPLAEFLYALGLAVGPESLPTLIHWWMGVLSTIAVFSLGRRVMSERAAAMGALIYAATPTLAYSAASSKQELFLSLYGWLALYALLAWRADRRPGWLALAGVMAGLGAATKLTGLYAYPILGLIALWVLWERGERDWRKFVRAGVLYGGPAVLVILPWSLRNFIVAGDPFWPTGAGLFASRYVTPAMYGFVHEVRTDYGIGRSLGTFVFGLWHLTQNYAPFSDLRTPMTPLFLLFLPAAGIGWRERSASERFALGAMLVFCAGVYAFWWTQVQMPRFIYVLWGVASLAAGATAAMLWDRGAPGRLGVVAGFGLTVVLSAAASLVFSRQFVPVLTGQETREEYLRRNVSYYADFRAASELTQPDSRVLVFEALSLYYLDRDYLMGLPPWEGMIDYDQYDSGSELLPPLRRLGITHILWLDKGGHVADLLGQLRQGGYLEEIYRNPEGRRVTSRTLGQAESTEVVLWQIRYPAEVRP